jgi:hypothetical protein
MFSAEVCPIGPVLNGDWRGGRRMKLLQLKPIAAIMTIV